MNIFKFDSPVMNFIGKVADFIILNILTLVCSIPIITFGAAYTAKYYVSMRIIRGEEGTVFKPYFKAFKDNFKQATFIWIIQLWVLVLLGVDWIWIYNKGFKNVNELYLIALGLLTLFVIFITITIFPFIARFDMTIKEAFKGAGIFSFLYFIKLLLIVGLEIITFIACIWYAHWLPAILLFGTTTAFYFMNLTLVKGFKKLEDKLAKEGGSNKDVEDAFAKDDSEENAEEAKEEKTDATDVKEKEEKEESKLGDTIVLRPDEHTLKGKLEAEKETFKSLDTKEKVRFIRDYYGLKIFLGICVAIFAIWFIYDAFLSQKEMIYSGGLLFCVASEEGKEYLTDDFLDKVATNKRKQQVNLSDDLTMTLVEGVEGQELKTDPSQDQYLFPMIVAGYYDYFLIDAKFIDHYIELDCFKDITSYADMYNIPEEDRYVYIPEDEEVTEADLTERGISAIKLPEDICKKIGVDSLSGEGVYLALILNDKSSETDDTFMQYVFGDN